MIKKFLKKIQLNAQRGITVVELLLYMAILATLITILTSIFVSALDVQSESSAVSGIQQDGNYIIAKLGYDIHRAQSINIPSSNGLPPTDNFQIVINSINNTYSTDANGNLILTNDSGPSNLNSYGSNVSAFLISRFGNAGGVEDTLKINFRITSRTKRVSGPEIKDFQTNFSLRRQ